MTAYPSIAATLTGRRLGALCYAVPLRTHDVPAARLLIALPLWLIVVPIAMVIGLTLYALQKLFGRRYVLTNRSVQVRQMIGLRTIAQVPLADIKDIVIQELPGQVFYKAADLVLTGNGGKALVRLEGVSRAAVFRQTILEARDSRVQIEASLKVIQARKV